MRVGFVGVIDGLRPREGIAKQIPATGATKRLVMVYRYIITFMTRREKKKEEN